MKKKVFLLQEIIPSYRVPVFKRIADIDGIALTIFYSDPSPEMKKNNLQNSANLNQGNYVKLPLFHLGRF
ncbi:MAG: hypothetical protein J7L77_05335, partial [Clostridiales bacterium]|nr:hypothetical protein [Clostridiales bacterium]